MKRLFAFTLLIVSLRLNAQKNIDGLIRAEKSFAAYSVAHGTKDAFLKFLDSNGVVFNQGKAVNGIEIWNKRENGQQVLSWSPQYAEIATSNDFGYTTGPWELRPNANNDSVIARGQYTTVWHIDANGEWKFLVDLGVGTTPKVLALNVNKIKAKKITGNATINEILKAEQNFIDAYRADKTKAYSAYLSKQSILNRNGPYHPAISRKSQSAMITNSPAIIQFTILGSGIASSGDMAYVYGSAVIHNKVENYLHIWRKEKDGWKMALEVLRY
ncbi:MAG TPA: nuclear transport factor 2 family protein [Flavisolibacter sp.]|nr:nuclear transport factor 2 family protein [Flavisolibacter sp.]